MRAARTADVHRRLVQLQHKNENLTSLSRRTLLRLAGPSLIGTSLLTQTGLGIAQQLPAAGLKRVAAATAVAWFNDRNDGLSTRGTIIGNATDSIKKALDLNENISMTFGRNLTKRGLVCQVWIFSDHFFVFPVTKQDEESLDIEENSIRTWTSSPRKDTTTFPFAANLASLTIGNAPALNGGAAIAGHVFCVKVSDVSADCSLRLTYRTEEYTRQSWITLPQGQIPEGTTDFTFDQVNEAGEKKPYGGPLVLFLVLCTVERPRGGEAQFNVLSNPVAAMVRIVAG